MIEDAPTRIEQHEWERGLWWMVVASGGLHALIILIAVLAPLSFIDRRPAPMSYTVDLIAPDRLGGSNAVAGGKGRTTGPPLVAAPPPVEAPAPAAPPQPKVEEPKAAPKVEVQAPEPKPEPPKVEPEKPAPPQVASKPEPPPPPAKVEEPKPQVKPIEPEPKPKVVEAKPEPPPKPNEMALKDKAKKPEPPPSPVTKPAAPAQAVAKAEPPKPPDAKPAAQAKAAAPAPTAAQTNGAAKPAEAKADAKKTEGKAGSGDLDARIASAVKRVEQQSGVRGGGLGSKPGDAPGGPISVGPGEGAGGAVMGFEYLMYLNRLQARLKENWAWAGAERNRKAVVHFSILETGEVADVRITESSGDPSYDASVERAVRAANPLPPPPETYRKQFSDVEYTFTPESMEM